MDERHRSVEPDRGCSSISVAPAACSRPSSAADVVDVERDVVHALAAALEEPPDRGVLGERRQQLDAAALAEQQRQRLDALSSIRSAPRPRPEQPLVASDGGVEVAHGDAEVVDSERRHARMVPWRPQSGSSGAIMHVAVSTEWEAHVSQLDKVKEKASDALESGKEVVHSQLLKLHLRRLEGEVDSASAAFGAAAFDLYEAGSLSSSSDLGALAARVRDARARRSRPRSRRSRGRRG